ncbi:hypothetical protein AGABI2DRAFT_139824 [Agaricus bisporus var. bisporus H97]|uniref:hypothetical protein n=1 Tax=Agaricus bisporus var. bisporus (strain H97 / ATCC MYA-4626 / FGSC 10389) TaxID=936046 RepID=UPI00029F6244|nr:hypothetical protein AGABI2DRAFT_139824 [Agaricus bisporus var. bisporus H97]EKV41879.1 hypothetical protein AGABI2DRAFT_139824 [Agaricus bisporus var. bisporus H97]
MIQLIKLLVEMCELCWLVRESVRSSFVELEEITVQLRRHGSNASPMPHIGRHQTLNTRAMHSQMVKPG